MPFSTFLVRNCRWLAGGFLLCFFPSFGQTFFISLSAGDIRREYGLSHGSFGTLYMAATLLSALTLPQLGRIVDHIRACHVLLLTLPLLAFATLSMAYASTWLWLFATIYLLRLFGQGMMTHNAMTAMGRWFSAQRGRAVSIASLGNQAGEALFPLVFVALAPLIGWRQTWLFSAAAILLVGLPAIYVLIRTERMPSASDGPERRFAARHWTRSEVLRDPVFWFALSGVLAPGFIATTIFFHQVYLVELRHWSLEVFAGAFVVSSTLTVVFSLVTGYLIDRYSAVDILPFYLVPLAAACFTLAFIDSQWSAFAFMALLGASLGSSTTLFGALWPEIYGVRHLGSIRAVIVALMVFATAMGPGITGFLIDAGVPYSWQIAGMGIYCLFGIFVMNAVRSEVQSRNTVLPAEE
ncbi:MFS transporter [Sinorhizobium medicae]|uniref:MFS transporter n=1 Tax=Sinorhizobium medicae TaxID=110321 RepID=UPI0011A72547|nr:MFS transporter [Sinorhizobium medicae]TWA42348.1 sugar phosphate permease [Sinorhizobium medicae]